MLSEVRKKGDIILRSHGRGRTVLRQKYECMIEGLEEQRIVWRRKELFGGKNCLEERIVWRKELFGGGKNSFVRSRHGFSGVHYCAVRGTHLCSNTFLVDTYSSCP